VANAIEVSDSRSNAEEHIERAAKTVGRGRVRPKVFALCTGICTGPSVDAGGAETMTGTGSRGARPPDVTRYHGQEGADARGDRSTHSAPARL